MTKKAILTAALALPLCLGPVCAAIAVPAKTKPNKVMMSAGAKAILDKHGMTLQGGVLRKRGAKEGKDLAFGSGPIRCAVHPDDKDALAVGVYDRGSRQVIIKIGFEALEKFGPSLTPENEPGPALQKLFPKKG